MIRIFFKTIWNNRKRNILVFIELFMISLVLVNLTVYLVNLVTVFRIKNCYDTHNVILITLSKKTDEDPTITGQSFRNLKTILSSNPLVESVSLSTNAIPYNYNLYSNDFTHENDRFSLALRQVDIDYAEVMKINPLKGRWFDATDIGKSVNPVIVSKDIDEEYFSGSAIGQTIEERHFQGSATEENNFYEIIGVVDHFKRSDTEKPYSFGFLFQDLSKPQSWWGIGIMIRTKEGKTGDVLAVAESQVYSTLNPDAWTISSLNSLENMRDRQNYDNAQRHYLSLIIAVFILINVFLGVIGILWYNTNLRIHEIGIKRALGSTGTGINRLLLAGVGLLIVALVLLQIPSFMGTGNLLPGVYIKSIWISVAVMIVLVLLSTWIPARLASKIVPASALKTE
jgi:putative ABC transport system permease protein